MAKGGCGGGMGNVDIDRAWQRSERQESLDGKLPKPDLLIEFPQRKPENRTACIEDKEGTLICGPIVPNGLQKPRPEHSKL